MIDLKVGDKVLTSDGTFSDIYVFSHQERHHLATFMQITTVHNHTLEATPDHFVPVSLNCDGNMVDTRASAVRPGMCLLGRSQGACGLEMQPVVDVSTVLKRGIYNPFTLNGDLVVNNVVASSHSRWFLDDIADTLGLTSMLPRVYQAILAPARGMYHMVGPKIARDELEKFQDKLNSYTNDGAVLAPFLDLGWRAFEILSGRP